jgi:hypothetical protein
MAANQTYDIADVMAPSTGQAAIPNAMYDTAADDDFDC